MFSCCCKLCRVDDDDDGVHGESTIVFCRGFSLLGEGAFYLIHHCDNFPLLLAICLPINSSRGTNEKKSAKEEREKYGQGEREQFIRQGKVSKNCVKYSITSAEWTDHHSPLCEWIPWECPTNIPAISFQFIGSNRCHRDSFYEILCWLVSLDTTTRYQLKLRFSSISRGRFSTCPALNWRWPIFNSSAMSPRIIVCCGSQGNDDKSRTTLFTLTESF